MPTWRYTGIGSGLLAFLMGTVAPLQKAGAQVAGTVGAVNTDANGAPPGGSSRTLSVGQSVVQQERISTDASGTVHLMFNDRSALNVGRNASVVIDRFVYNPNASGGEQAVSLARGAARFVGGQISHSNGAEVKTPVATIGVRGGNITVRHLEGATVVMVHNGAANVTDASGTAVVRSGYQCIVRDGGPCLVTPIDMALLRVIMRQLASQGSQTGGVKVVPTDPLAARNSIGVSRPASQTPNFDLPAAGDDLARGFAATRNRPNRPYP